MHAKLLLTLLLTFSAILASGQSEFFEGRIKLTMKYYDSDNNEIDPETIGRDKEMNYFISNGNYKSLNEDGVLSQLFNSETNRYYFNNNGTIQYIDASMPFPQEGKVEILDGGAKILNQECKKLKITSESNITTYYYSSGITINPEYYANHNVGNWNTYLSASSGALSLKYEIVAPSLGITTIMEAVEIEEMEFSDDDFNIESYLQE